MRYLLTPQVRTTTQGATGAPTDSWADGTAVWGSLTTPRESRRVGAGRYEYPVDKVSRVDHADWAVAGNRVKHGTTVYEILGVDADGDVTRLDLREVTR